MADSDNSISVSAVTNASGVVADDDLAVRLAGCWRRANQRVSGLGRMIDELERDVLQRGAGDWSGGAAGGSGDRTLKGWGSFVDNPRYEGLRDAEVVSMAAEESLVDLLPQVEARSIAGVIAKLEMILGADGLIEDRDEFPIPHIRSVLTDLRRIAAPGRDQPH